MTNTDQEKMDAVLARMLKTPPKPHKPKDAKENGKLSKANEG